MIQTIDPFEICSLAEQSNRSKPGISWSSSHSHEKAGGADAPLPSDAAGRLGKVFAYMQEHLDQPVSISSLGQIAGVSVSTFYVLFKAATGHTPNDFFTRARMQRAGELLAGTNLRVKEVAAVVGYEDQFYFSRVFKSVQGLSPREYRAALHEGEASKKQARFSERNSPAMRLNLAAAAAGPYQRADYARTRPLPVQP